MANNQDARPFIDLQKDAEEFQAKFEEDIEKCKSILDAKITALICDPDSLGNSVGPKQNALVEFSKAKYDIYISMKSLMNDMEREWLKYISEMKKLFIDNVEVFLANTKLEVKLPSSGYLPSTGPKKSPGLRKSTAVTSSIYPIISSITKSIPVFSQKDKSTDLEMETDEAEMDKTNSRAGRSSRRKTVIERVIETETSVPPNTVTFAAEDDSNDDLDIYTPVARPSKSTIRRKTLLPNLEESLSGPDILPRNYPSARSKRKTFSVSDLSSVAPSKRLKSSNIQKSNATAKDYGAAADNNLLETDDSYSEWIALRNIDGQIPTDPAIYEVKVWRAKKTAYIGCCDSLRQKLTLHKLGQNSGHKHLDKFIERNYDDIQIRYEVVSSVNDAKVEVKNRVNSFVAQHKTTPAYN